MRRLSFMFDVEAELPLIGESLIGRIIYATLFDTPEAMAAPSCAHHELFSPAMMLFKFCLPLCRLMSTRRRI